MCASSSAPSGVQAAVRAARQRGAVLVVALALLVVMTVLTLAALQGGVLSGRVGGNERDRALALAAAEAALVDAEASLPTIIPPGANCDTLFLPNCDNGLCLAPGAPPAQPVWQQFEAQSQPYGRWTNAPALALDQRPAAAPRFLIEMGVRDTEINGVRPVGGETRRTVFRIWAWGYGLNAKTVVLLETLVYPPQNYCVGS